MCQNHLDGNKRFILQFLVEKYDVQLLSVFIDLSHVSHLIVYSTFIFQSAIILHDSFKILS